MYPLSIVLFLVYCWSSGLGLGLLVKESEDFLERNLMRIGIGLGGFLAIGFLLNLLRVPLDWRIFLLISICLIIIKVFLILKKGGKGVSVFGAFKHFKPNNFKLNIYPLLMLILFAVSFYMYGKGAFSYPYLEDDDSWSHAVGIKFVSIEKTVFAGKNNPFHYIDPYPPAYDMLIGILHQTNGSLYWTLKFFNALIISLSIIFFYFFVKAFTESPKKAFFSTFALFAMPAFLSHFIWAIAITMPLFFVSFYAFEKIKHDNKWWLVSAIVFMPTLTSSPSHSAYFAVFLALAVMGRTIMEKKLLVYPYLAVFSGFLLSFVLWWLPMSIVYEVNGILEGVGIGKGTSVASIAGTGDKVYSLNDFIYLPKDASGNAVNMINNPIGIGPLLSLLLIIGIAFLIYKYFAEFKKYKFPVIILFSAVISLLTFFLFRTYIKFVDKVGVESLPPGSVPFFEFLSDKIFLVIAMSIVIFILSILAVMNYKNYKSMETENKSKNKYLFITFLWLALAFYAVNAGPFYFKLSPFRAWVLLAIPVSILCGESINLLATLTSSISKNIKGLSKIPSSIPALLITGLIFYGITVTSFTHKYSINTSVWFPGGFWTSNEEIRGYMWFKDNVPNGAKVFAFSNPALIIGLDKFMCSWCNDEREYRSKGFSKSVEENYQWLKKGKYEYLIIDGQTARKFGASETSSKIQELANSGKFKPIFSNNGMIVFKVA